MALALYWYLLRVRRERGLGRLGILAAVALAGVRTALGFVEVRVAPGAVDVAKRARLADVLRQRRGGSPITRLAADLVRRGVVGANAVERRKASSVGVVLNLEAISATRQQPLNGLEHKSDNFSIQSSPESPKNRRMRRGDHPTLDRSQRATASRSASEKSK